MSSVTTFNKSEIETGLGNDPIHKTKARNMNEERGFADFFCL